MRFPLRSYLSGLLSLAAAGCVSSSRREILVFTTIVDGEYRISTIWSDGSHLKPFLVSQKDRNYAFASGNSLRSLFIVLVQERNPEGVREDHLYAYYPTESSWHRLEVGDGYEGSGVVSPDNGRAVFTLAPRQPFGKLRLWTLNLQTGQANRLTGQEGEADRGEWDQYPAWSPDGQQVSFMRYQRADHGVSSALMQIPSTGGKPSVVLGTDQGIGGFCYAPDGKRLAVLTQRGLEVIGIPELSRTIILPWNRFPNYQFRTGGLKWSRTEDKIALALFNQQRKQSELWIISTDGKDAKLIYSVPSEILVLSSFIQP